MQQAYEGGGGDYDSEETGGIKRYTPFDANEVFATVSENFELHNGTATVQVRCAWNLRYQVVQEFLEGGENNEPTDHPFWNSFNLQGTPMVATSVRIEPMQTKYSANGQTIVYPFALITLSYAMMATEVKVESTNQYLTIAPNNLYWEVNGEMIAVAPEEAPGVRLASYDLTLSHPHIQCVDPNGVPLQQYEGYCNEEAISVTHNGVKLHFEPQTLLCTAPSISAGANLFGSGFNNISVRLSYNPIGHNEFFNPLQGKDKEIADITAHKVKMYKHIGGTEEEEEEDEEDKNKDKDDTTNDDENGGDDNNENEDNENEDGDEEGKEDEKKEPLVTGEFQRVLIYPTREFIPLFKAFKLHVDGEGDGDGADPDGTTGTPEYNPDDCLGEYDPDKDKPDEPPEDTPVDGD